MEIVRLQDIWVRHQDQIILKGVELAIERGEFLGLIGPNGAGKTTLLKVILGLIQPHQGRVEVFGRTPQGLGGKRHLIGYVPQRSLIDWQFPASVFDVVMMGRYGKMGLFRRPNSRDKEAVLRSLERVGMGEFAKRQIGQLSAGQQQRVFIARALVAEPQLLLLDEATVGVDAAAQERFYQLLGNLKRDFGLTIVLVSHDISIISTHVEKIACLNQSLYCHATPTEVLSTGTLEKVYGCEIEMLAHGQIPHRVIRKHP